jgi:LmbE family N-acetylglucosaminyl deacetylase
MSHMECASLLALWSSSGAGSCRLSQPTPKRQHAALLHSALAAVAVALAVLLAARTATAAGPAELKIGHGERLLVVAPHPDDETIATGGLIQRVLENGGEVHIVLVTAGDGFVEAVAHETLAPQPRPSAFIAYGEKRLREARAAVRVLAPDHVRLEVLGFPDGGLDGLLQAHWWRSRPERSRTTFATDPPYDDQALEPDVLYDGDDLRRELERVIAESQPTIVAFPDPLDRHPDHRATGLFTLLALADWLSHQHGDHGERATPELLAYLVHDPAWPPGWDATGVQPRSSAPLELPVGAEHHHGTRVALVLTDEELATKEDALARYPTQLDAIGALLTAFLRGTEPFTILPPSAMKHVAQMIEHGVDPHPRKSPRERHHGR